MKKQLSVMERFVIKEFASANAHRLCCDQFIASGCQAILNVLAYDFVGILRHDMCQGTKSLI